MKRNQQAIETIKKLYKEQRYSLSQFSELIGKSKSAWIRRESLEVPLTLDEVDFIAEKLGTDFGTISNSNNSFVINNKGLVANSGINATISINLTQDQFNKIIDILN